MAGVGDSRHLLPDYDPDDEVPSSSPQEVLDLLDRQASLLVSVSTNGARFGTVERKYKTGQRRLKSAVRRLGVPTPFPYEDVWEWHGYYSQHLPKYFQRRDHIRELAKPAREALERLIEGGSVSDSGSPGLASWSDLDSRVEGVVEELRAADSRDDLQDVGRRCREILIDAGKLLADPHLVPEGAEAPKAADAKAWLDLYLAKHGGGRSHKELRAFVPVAWDLAQKVTHGDITRVDAYAAAQATLLIVRTLQQMAS